MADLATPSGAAMFDGGNAETKKVEKQKPEKPDDATYKKDLAKAQKEHDDAKAKFDAIKQKVDNAQPSKNKDTPAAKRRGELLDQLKEIREKQQSGKAGRGKVMDEIKRHDERLKSLIQEQKLARSRTPFKSVEDVDREINRLKAQVDGGMMKLVDEKKALAEISSLNKQRKGFAGFDDAQKTIDETKKKISSLRDSLGDPESRALSDKYTKLQGELDAIKAEQDDVYKNIKSLREDRDRLHAEQQVKYMALKKVKDDYFHAGRAAQQYEWEQRQKAKQRRAAEQEAFENQKKKERAQKLLDEAGDKAYLDEIRKAESLVRFLDPSYKKDSAPLQAPSQFQAQAQRKVDDAGFKGVKVVKKEEEDYFAGTGGKKGKKGRKAAAATDTGAATPPASTSAKYSCPPSVMEDCASMGIEPPMSKAEIPETLEKVLKKLDWWKEHQDEQTQKNIEKAKKEVERLDTEDSSAAPTESAHVNGHGHGETKGTASVDEGGSIKNEIDLVKGAVADVTADLKGASLEDNATA